MDASEQFKVFDQLANKARRAGLVRYHDHGVLIVIQPDGLRPPATVAAVLDSARRPEATAQPAGPASAG